MSADTRISSPQQLEMVFCNAGNSLGKLAKIPLSLGTLTFLSKSLVSVVHIAQISGPKPFWHQGLVS